jgi:hypothetical protein
MWTCNCLPCMSCARRHLQQPILSHGADRDSPFPFAQFMTVAIGLVFAPLSPPMYLYTASSLAFAYLCTKFGVSRCAQGR